MKILQKTRTNKQTRQENEQKWISQWKHHYHFRRVSNEYISRPSFPRFINLKSKFSSRNISTLFSFFRVKTDVLPQPVSTYEIALYASRTESVIFRSRDPKRSNCRRQDYGDPWWKTVRHWILKEPTNPRITSGLCVDIAVRSVHSNDASSRKKAGMGSFMGCVFR